MKVLVINCSPKGKNSDCLKLTKAFLKGLGEEDAEIIHAVNLTIHPCIGCYTCWRATPGKCVYEDDMPVILKKLTAADLVIWSTPLYCCSMPAIGKAIIDRTMPLTCPEQKGAGDGRTYHPTRQENRTRFMLISGCGFPNMEHNYEPLLMQFALTFRNENFPRITCVEAPLLSIPEAAPVALPYLKLVEKAGREFLADGCISKMTQKNLDTPMLQPEEYRAGTAK